VWTRPLGNFLPPFFSEWQERAVWQLIPSPLALLWDSRLHTLNPWHSSSADIPFSPGLSFFFICGMKALTEWAAFGRMFSLPQRMGYPSQLFIASIASCMKWWIESCFSIRPLTIRWQFSQLHEVWGQLKICQSLAHTTLFPERAFPVNGWKVKERFQLVPWPARISGFFLISPVSGNGESTEKQSPWSRLLGKRPQQYSPHLKRAIRTLYPSSWRPVSFCLCHFDPCPFIKDTLMGHSFTSPARLKTLSCLVTQCY